MQNILHKLTKNTQFIVITHRRGTMVAADRLYGITMQEKGVSTLVSVNLIEGPADRTIFTNKGGLCMEEKKKGFFCRLVEGLNKDQREHCLWNGFHFSAVFRY